MKILICIKKIILINTSRGKVVDLKTVVQGLESGKLRGACLDVFENEKVEKLLSKPGLGWILSFVFVSLGRIYSGMFGDFLRAEKQYGFITSNGQLVRDYFERFFTELHVKAKVISEASA